MEREIKRKKIYTYITMEHTKAFFYKIKCLKSLAKVLYIHQDEARIFVMKNFLRQYRILLFS